MSASADDETAPSAPAQGLVMGLLGLHVLGRARTVQESGQPVPTQVFLTVLGKLGVSASATRTTLNRLVGRGLLVRHKQGRASAFQPTADAIALLRQGRARMFSPTPFDHAECGWTILNCPVPESLRKVRYQLHNRLSWAGFGMVQANLWVAPGRIDVDELLGDIFPAEALGLVQAFHGVPTGPSSPAQLAHAAWDPDALRAAHLDFLSRWEDADPLTAEPLSQLLLLLDDWGRLLRTDPGLPATHLGDDWPAQRSSQTFRRLETHIGPLAEEQLQQLVRAHSY
ncbi:PaaX family transcriptional regulator C-terminal domain-containing protein [Streptomyces sp. NPDC051987]|uniref:PaaX family transcriptional regulator n=1 Tax=Streptomyces sp. NPDC051987 TaxID=3155808 RepID=UPI00343B6DE3